MKSYNIFLNFSYEPNKSHMHNSIEISNGQLHDPGGKGKSLATLEAECSCCIVHSSYDKFVFI